MQLRVAKHRQLSMDSSLEKLLLALGAFPSAAAPAIHAVVAQAAFLQRHAPIA